AAGQPLSDSMKLGETNWLRAKAPVMAVDSDGVAHVLWEDGQEAPVLRLQSVTAAGPTAAIDLDLGASYDPGAGRDIAYDASSDTLLVTWNSTWPRQVHFRRFDLAGNPIAEPKIVNDNSTGNFVFGDCALDVAADGSYTVAWTETFSYFPMAVARCYGADGVAKSDPIMLTEEDEFGSGVAGINVHIDPAGRSFVAWHFGFQFVQGRVISADGTTAGPLASLDVELDGQSERIRLGNGASDDEIRLAFANDGGWGEPDRIQMLSLDATTGLFAGDVADVAVTSGDLAYEALDMTVLADGAVIMAYTSNDWTDGSGSDIVGLLIDGSTSTGLVLSDDPDEADQATPALAMSAAGGLIAWTDSRDGVETIWLRELDAAGGLVGNDQLASEPNSSTAGDRNVTVAINDDGAGVIAWWDGDTYRYRFRRYELGLGFVGEIGQVDTPSSVFYPHSVGIAADGSFVIAWEERRDHSTHDIFAQRFDADGVALGGNLLVAVSATIYYRNPDLAMRPDGDFVITWTGSPNPVSNDIYARRYHASGSPMGPQVQLRQYAYLTVQTPAAALAEDGTGLVTWMDYRSGGSRGEIWGRRLTTAGAPYGNAFRLDGAIEARDVRNPDVVAMADGSYSVAWDSTASHGGSAARIELVNYQPGSGTGDIIVPTDAVSPGLCVSPSLAVGSQGLVLGWAGNHMAGRGYDAWLAVESAPCPGDLDGNGQVDVEDLLAVLAAFGSTDAGADINGDGMVDVEDVLMLLANWNSDC
ncbi:MAG: hypothetical protein MK116_03500, partial [Phycisphaerales bacterium]|nr:hypothetical protein [Phycisphaerales bacterium]